LSLTREQIDRAVDDEDWQRFRKSLKGKTTQHKLRMLRQYMGNISEDVRVRVLNYLNALSRGGQIEPLPRQDYTFAELFVLLDDNKVKVRR
jgi:hypothetical protein